ncbi:ribosome maturation factor RimP [Candidatus Nitronereus thalassa]|uniref:Ribosome maturation factor RimP n=1 Tax=Candidatus Nitronereus thalassa TaxID=3020898 RepID=A0ABU3K795_9BACT|nr:ribosome maturation factor RimP [Candidatus Nitronereus thalassa]MDT7042314.1 ribosome maturation factor RimP [Candidatus Nitronereus thalassa]
MPASIGALAFERGKWYCPDSGKWARAHFFLLCRHPRGSTLLGLELGTKDLGKQVQLIAEPIARALDLEVLEVICHGRGAGSAIRITLDKEGGVGIRDCEQFHQSLSRALAVADPIPFDFGLEVSSPGVDRPLKNPQDFQRVMGKLLKVKFQDPGAEPQQVIGRLVAITETGLTLTVQTGKQRQSQEVEIFWNSILEGKQQVEF